MVIDAPLFVGTKHIPYDVDDKDVIRSRYAVYNSMETITMLLLVQTVVDYVPVQTCTCIYTELW